MPGNFLGAKALVVGMYPGTNGLPRGCCTRHAKCNGPGIAFHRTQRGRNCKVCRSCHLLPSTCQTPESMTSARSKAKTGPRGLRRPMLLPAIWLWIAITCARMRLDVHSNIDYSLSDTGTTASLTTRRRLCEFCLSPFPTALLRESCRCCENLVAASSISVAALAAFHPPLSLLYTPIARGGPEFTARLPPPWRPHAVACHCDDCT
jgi:hypothetical protein